MHFISVALLAFITCLSGGFAVYMITKYEDYMEKITESKHTDYFNQWIIDGNEENYFYDSNTFGLDYDVACAVMTNSAFRSYINSKMECNGVWCDANDKFTCVTSRSDCYHVEHILDENGPEFNIDCKQIAANRVMAYSQWNMNLGRIAVNNYQDSLDEKKTIYSEDIIDRVRRKISRCNPECINNYQDITKSSIRINNYLIAFIILSSFTCICSICTCISLYKWKYEVVVYDPLNYVNLQDHENKSNASDNMP